MKYMGSKRRMLHGDLGKLLVEEVADSERFVDMFTGSGAVASFVAESVPVPVVALDLQSYATALAAGTITRTQPQEVSSSWSGWVKDAFNKCKSDPIWSLAEEEDAIGGEFSITSYSARAKEVSSRSNQSIVKAFGGYYFSPKQAVILASLRSTLPSDEPLRDVCLASLITAASKAVAAPGHTAQPFKANETAGPFLLEAWKRDIWSLVRNALIELAPRHGLRHGSVFVSNAVLWAKNISAGDLVFIDPPYSGVHYSRFYHVLEAIAKGDVGPVTGSGRYVTQSERPRSDFSMRSTSKHAFDSLLSEVAKKKARAVITYPQGGTSNGLSGSEVLEISERHFSVIAFEFNSRFSTLGGNGFHRSARQESCEMILKLTP